MPEARKGMTHTDLGQPSGSFPLPADSGCLPPCCLLAEACLNNWHGMVVTSQFSPRSQWTRSRGRPATAQSPPRSSSSGSLLVWTPLVSGATPAASRLIQLSNLQQLLLQGFLEEQKEGALPQWAEGATSVLESKRNEMCSPESVSSVPRTRKAWSQAWALRLVSSAHRIRQRRKSHWPPAPDSLTHQAEWVHHVLGTVSDKLMKPPVPWKPTGPGGRVPGVILLVVPATDRDTACLDWRPETLGWGGQSGPHWEQARPRPWEVHVPGARAQHSAHTNSVLRGSLRKNSGDSRIRSRIVWAQGPTSVKTIMIIPASRIIAKSELIYVMRQGSAHSRCSVSANCLYLDTQICLNLLLGPLGPHSIHDFLQVLKTWGCIWLS